MEREKLPGKRKTLSRVDVQVSLLTACMVVLSAVCIFLIAYRFTYADTVLSLTERVESIHSYLENELDPASFTTINRKLDMGKGCYQDMKVLFHSIKQATGVRYLYTAKRAEDGTLVYVIDGLDYSAADFRFPGDPIEEEIIPDLERALNDERVMPDTIKSTAWGDIFIAYLPIHGEDGSVLGAIGIEFEAGHQYMTYQRLRQLIPLVILAVCVLSGGAALVLFRRISNPLYQDLASTDWLTDLKNRNAYELDTRNFAAKGTATGMGLLLADLNGLKRVNDTLGHEAGDLYIRTMADALRDARTGGEVCYRTGGDEFVVLLPGATEERLETYVRRLGESFDARKSELMPHASFSAGWAICPDSSRGVFDRTYQQADRAMYQSKSRYYAAHTL